MRISCEFRGNPAPPGDLQDVSTPATSTGRILVVDDQAANLRVVTALLSRQGYEVVAASTGDEALQL